MRLINVNTLKLEEFHHKIPPYAILSHTWGSDEVTFEMYQEYLNVTNRCLCPGSNARNSNIEIKAGFAKIMGACRRAKEDKLGYLWCDTNCIDKSSSAELTEAINSMYAWYRDSAVCYAYLADVGALDTVGTVTEEFRKSRWFTRGWTLQELLAPKEVLFFDAAWRLIDNRERLATTICEVTKIHRDALETRDGISTYSVAQRMSWAAHRHTSRQEDIAYCLLGIFGINMPLLYGEGLKAFTRLQEEIIKVSDDQSIFAWDFFGDEQGKCIGMLAPSPENFASCDSIVRETSAACSPFSLTNHGISLQLPMIRSLEGGVVLVGLNCSVQLHEYMLQGAPQRGKVNYWYFQVWIWLRLIRGNIYERSSVPTSRTSLLDIYPEVIDCNPTELYGIASQPLSSRSQIQTVSSHRRKPRNGVYTGLHVNIGFGRIKRGTTVLEEPFPPRHYGLARLPPRGSPALSHEIVWAGNYIVLLSVVWDHLLQQPVYWRPEFFVGTNNIPHWALNNWELLFLTPPKSSPGNGDSVRRIRYIHNQIRKQLILPISTIEMNAEPFVYCDKDLRQDQHNQPTIVAHVTFQEVGK